MNNIYVDELPKDCLDCPCRDGESNKCNLIEFRPSIGYFDEKTLDFVYKPYYNKGEILDCPLKSLSDRLAEERKKVVQEIRDWCDKNGIVVDTFFDHKILKRIESRMCYVHEINKQLNQIENGNKDES